MESRLEQRSRNEALLREVNERIAEVDKAAEENNLASDETLFEFLCECGRDDGAGGSCVERVHMTIREYDQVRSEDDRFVVHPGHETEWLEWVAFRNDRFVIVDKRREAEPFVEGDPRGARSE